MQEDSIEIVNTPSSHLQTIILMKRSIIVPGFFVPNNSLSAQKVISFFSILIGLQIGLAPLHAQDVITFQDGKEMEVKVLEINHQSIKYKKYDRPKGPTYEALKQEVFMIKYPSGSKDVFSPSSATSSLQQTYSTTPMSTSSKKPKTAGKKHAIGVNPTGHILGRKEMLSSLHFERRIGKKGSIGLSLARYHKTRYGTNRKYSEYGKGAGMFLRRYFSGGAGMNGFFLGGGVTVMRSTFYESWVYEDRDYGDTGYATGLAVIAQLGYRFTIKDVFFIEPSIVGGGYGSSLDSIIYEEPEYKLDHLFTPAVTLGCLF